MTKEQKDKILKIMAEERNDYARDCDRRIAEEQGKIIGADYMLQRFLDVLNTEVDLKNTEVEPQGSAYDKCPICVNRHKNCQFGSSDCHFEEQTDMAESESKG